MLVRRPVLLPLAVAALAAAGLRAQPVFDPEAGRPHLRLFSPADYEAHYQVWSMVQGPEGIVYVGAFGGLLEYDGSTWRHLPIDSGSVRELVLTRDGRLWAAANNDFGWCDRDAAGGLRFHSLRAAVPRAAGAIGPMPDLVEAGDEVWLTTANGIVRWRGERPTFEALEGKASARLYQVADRLLMRRRGATMVSERRGDAWVPLIDDPALADRTVTFILPAADGALVLGLNQQGLWRWAEGRLAPWPTPAAAALAGARLYCALALPDGTLVIGTVGEGLFLLAADGTRARRLRIADGLPSDLIEGLGRDRAGRVWVSTYNGMAVFDWPPALTLFDRREGFDLATIQTISWQENRLFLAGIGGVYGLAPAEPAGVAPARMERRRPAEVIAGDTLRHASGTLFPTNGGIKRLGGGADDFALKLDDIVMALALSRHDPDRLFFASGKGLGSARFVDGVWRLEGYGPALGSSVRLLKVDETGAVWARTMDSHFWRLPPDAAGALDWSQVRPVRADTFPGWVPGGWVRVSAAETPLGLVFFSGRAILRFDAAAQRFVPEERFDASGRPPGDLLPISAPGREGLWCTAYVEGEVAGRRHGFGRFVFGGDGRARWEEMPADYAGIIGGFGVELAVADPTRAGVVWLKGTNAVGRLDLAHRPPMAPPAAPLIRRVRFGERRLALGEPVRVAWGPVPLVVGYAAPGTMEPRFRTRLRGWSEEWSEATTRSLVEFSGLPPGRYTFEVAVQTSDGRLGPASPLAVALMPPWWRSAAAWAGYGFVALGAVAGLVRWRLAQAARRERELEAQVAARTAELAAARDQAEAASRAKSAFLAAMSHELRTPLNGVLGYAQVLRADPRLTSDQQERLRVVQSSGEHLLRMINDVLDLAKIEAGKLELRPAPLPLGELVQEVAAAHAPAAAAKRLSFLVDVASNVPAWVTGDGQKLRQVLDNLVGNAIKFTARGRVELRVAALDGAVGGDGRIAFAVEDTGPGIAPEDQARLFQPFEQARQLRPEVPGAGLGLAISRALVERLGGSLSLASAPGRGSTFSFAVALPAAGAVAPGRAAPAVIGYDGPRRRILIVDDHQVNRDLLADLLQPLGFECVAEPGGEAALARLAAADAAWPDLAIIDVRMPGIDGVELTRRLRALPRGAGLRVLLTSASVLTFDPEEGRRAGCDGFLAKPFRADDLVAQLGRLLGLDWREAPAPKAVGATPGTSRGPWPEPARQVLREALAQGDLDQFRRELARVRQEHATEAARWDELDAAAAAFELTRLRHLLEQP